MNDIENARLEGPGAVKVEGPTTTACSNTPGKTQDLFAASLEMSAGDWIQLLKAASRIFGQAEARILWRGSPLPQPPDLPPIESSFVEHCLERKLGCSMRASEIYKAYCTWCDANGFEPLSVRGLGGALTRLGFTRRRSNQNLYMNVRLRRAGQGVA